MAGLFGLFGKKKESVAESSASVPQSEAKKEAFFLDSDSAKTWGDIEFMKKSKVVKRSFPKTLKGKLEDSVRSISSMAVTSLDGQVSENPSPQFSPETNGAASDRKRTDTSLDMFRQMAKDIKK